MRHQKKAQDSRGFTVLEMVVVLAIIAVMAAILTPLITSYVDKARHNAAVSDLQNIGSAITQFNTDMKFWPIYKVAFGSAGNKDPNNTNNIYDIIASKDGVDATFTETTWLASFTTNSFDTVVNTNFYTNVTPNGWKGPYFGFGSDPWRTKYYLTAKNL